jgi:hypothetical protein
MKEIITWKDMADWQNSVCPACFECVWSKETKVIINSNKKSNDDNNNRTEKLFICNR